MSRYREAVRCNPCGRAFRDHYLQTSRFICANGYNITTRRMDRKYALRRKLVPVFGAQPLKTRQSRGAG
jgi:hypothetical protein